MPRRESSPAVSRSSDERGAIHPAGHHELLNWIVYHRCK
jgi:hypothetical protein